VLAVNLLLAAPGVAGSRLREIADLEPVRDDLRVGIGVADAALGETLNAQEVA
jgi:flagellar basal body P-ring protein FlgI